MSQMEEALEKKCDEMDARAEAAEDALAGGRDRIAELEGKLERAYARVEEISRDWMAQRDRLAAVVALHVESTRAATWCAECDHKMPCPTLRAAEESKP